MTFKRAFSCTGSAYKTTKVSHTMHMKQRKEYLTDADVIRGLFEAYCGFAFINKF
jgi:hypothetical protein